MPNGKTTIQKRKNRKNRRRSPVTISIRIAFLWKKWMNRKRKPIALVTIDDAPDQHAAEIADKLHDLNASAIFL
ncbi:hypothetical protein QNN00_20720 [Bacillus velezensis]|nr:hypothetical protein [Bacillus velezensis]